jgi:hypothetical protein
LSEVGLTLEASNNSRKLARDNNILVVWLRFTESRKTGQKNTGSSHDITFHKSTNYGATWPTSDRKTLATNVGANPRLPDIVSTAANQLMVVYRTATNLRYRTSSDYGNTWAAAAAVPSSRTFSFCKIAKVRASPNFPRLHFTRFLFNKIYALLYLLKNC